MCIYQFVIYIIPSVFGTEEENNTQSTGMTNIIQRLVALNGFNQSQKYACHLSQSSQVWLENIGNKHI